MRHLAMFSLIALLNAPIALADDAAPKLEALQGTWTVVRYVNAGEEVTPEATETLKITGNHYELKTGDGAYRGDLTIDPKASPATIDATLFDTKDKDLGKAAGIYKMEGEKLVICWDEAGGDRPKTFSSKSGTKVRLITLEKR